MTVCGKYKDPNYAVNYRLKNRHKFNGYTKKWVENQKIINPNYKLVCQEKSRKYYAENKEYILFRDKCKREGEQLPDKRSGNGQYLHLSKYSHKKKTSEKKVEDPADKMSVKHGSFFIDWS
tara:strand:- start:117 stop:479 length:363 start_codon:yes stop_codon:yes gene_type:complete